MKSKTKIGGGQSPRQRFLRKIEAERNEVRDKSKIREPKSSMKELLAKTKK